MTDCCHLARKSLRHAHGLVNNGKTNRIGKVDFLFFFIHKETNNSSKIPYLMALTS
jgi:hypothetical protein